MCQYQIQSESFPLEKLSVKCQASHYECEDVGNRERRTLIDFRLVALLYMLREDVQFTAFMNMLVFTYQHLYTYKIRIDYCVKGSLLQIQHRNTIYVLCSLYFLDSPAASSSPPLALI